MRAWQVHSWSEPDQMRFEEAPVPEPGPGQVRISTRAAALNFFDILQIGGKYQVKPPLPFTPGAEASGIVDAVGANVTHVKPGDRVAAIVWTGGYAESAVAEARRTFLIADGLSFEEAASMPVVYHTSYFALENRAALRAGEWLLVHAGASGVGMAAIQIGKAMGARVIATAGSAEKLEFCKMQGAEHTIQYKDPAWVDEVKRLTGRGADVIYDPVGGDIFDLSTKCIATEGRLLVVGFASGRIPSIQANRILLKDISICGVHWGPYADAHPEYLRKTQDALDAMSRRGAVRPVVARTYPLQDAVRALADLTGRHAAGKVVLTV